MEPVPKFFNILSIDGGGIRGIIPAKFLAGLEAHLQKHRPGSKLHDHFDLICGTSTGAILAIGLSLGIPAKELLAFYKQYARSIFLRWIWNIDKVKALYGPMYSNRKLLAALHEVYKSSTADHKTALMSDCKTRLCIPAFNGLSGEINVFKTNLDGLYTRDYMIPAHHAALSSASAPVYFPPHSFSFQATSGEGRNINMIDGGLFANNPALIGLFEATDKLGYSFGEVKMLSVGTGRGKHILKRRWKPPSFRFWLIPNPRLFDIMLDAQSQITEQYFLFLKRSMAALGQQITYERIQYDFPEKAIPLNSSRPADLERLEVIGDELSKKHVGNIYNLFIKK
ncbi:MAG: patatin-like phospholipase family protein [Sphingobacteriales bacterium]|nr:patatin-like phospholipase family protein [Sphingobacteriales bacterium]